MTIDWIALLPEYVEKVLKSTSNVEYDLTLMELGAKMKDAHSFAFGVAAWMSLKLGEYLLNAGITYLPDNKVYVDEVGVLETGLQLGDQIISIDNIPIDTLIKRYKPYFSGGRLITTYDDILRRSTQSNVRDHVFDVIRDGNMTRVEVSYYKREEIKEAYQTARKPLEELNANTCYVDIRKVTKMNYMDVFDQASEYKTMILDMRSYPYVDFINILNECVLNEKQRFALFKRQDPENIGCFTTDSTSHACYTSPDTSNRRKTFYTQIIGLVNHRTISHVEYILQMLKTYDKFISVGNNTVGANGSIIRLQIAHNFNVTFSVLKVIDPREGVTNGVGHTPDYLIPLTETVKEDGILKKAIRLAG